MKLKPKTAKQIKTEIELLKKGRDKIVPCSMFGNDNLASLDAMVEVLEKNLDEDDIYEKWESSEEGDEPTQQDVLSAALEVRRWADGEESDIKGHLIDDFPKKK